MLCLGVDFINGRVLFLGPLAPIQKILWIFHESLMNVIFSFLVSLQEMEGIVSRAAGMHSQDFNG